MRIFFMSDAPARLLEPLAVYFAHGRGDDVVFATGKHRQEAPLPDIRRIVMNFQVSVWHTGSSSVDFLWREALRNGNAGKKVMEGLAGSWRPDIILCRSSHGGAFFVRDVFPDTFMASFATLADCEAGARVVCKLDCLLFLESQLCFAPRGSACLPFPPPLRPQILPEPFYADTEFFTQEPGPPFSCWKFSDSQKPLIFFNLKGIREEDYSRWLGAVLETLRDSPDMLAVIAADKGRMMAKWLGALNRLEDFYQERIYLTDFLTREEQKSVYRTAIKAIIANPECRADILECASCGGNAACVPDPFLDGLDVTFRLRERDLAASIRTMPEKDARDTATNREKIVRYFSRKQPIRTLAERIVEAYRDWHQRKTAPGMRGRRLPAAWRPWRPGFRWAPPTIKAPAEHSGPLQQQAPSAPVPAAKGAFFAEVFDPPVPFGKPGPAQGRLFLPAEKFLHRLPRHFLQAAGAGFRHPGVVQARAMRGRGRLPHLRDGRVCGVPARQRRPTSWPPFPRPASCPAGSCGRAGSP